MLRLAWAPALIVLLLASVTSCKKESPSGLPPAKDWGSAPEAAKPGSAPGAANPHAGPGAANPHGGMGAASPHGTGGTGGTGGGPVAEQTQPRSLEKLPDGRSALGPFSAAVPADWTEKLVTSSMRAAHYLLPAPSGEAELVVYYFGETGAGDVQANLDRWVGQFQQPGGKPSKDAAKVEKVTFAGQEATIVSVTGRYVTTSMPGGGDPIDKTDQSMIAAIVGSPKGPYYFKLVGPKATIAVQGPKLRAMLASLKLR